MSRIFERNEKIVERCIRGEYILVPVMQSEAALDSLYTLNETAGLIWREASSGIHDEDIMKHLSNRFDVDNDTARKDVTRILAELVDIGAISELMI